MRAEELELYDFSKDHFNPKMVREQVDAFDNRMEDDMQTQAIAKAVYCTKFWRHLEDLDSEEELLNFDSIEVNKLKPAISTYIANLYPRRMKVVLGHSPYSKQGDAKKAELLVNDWMNRPIMRQRVLLAARQALLFKGAGAKIGYDAAKEGSDRVWMRVFPYWELLLDSDVHDWDDARFIGHISYRPKSEIEEEYQLSNLSGTSRLDFLDGDYDHERHQEGDESTAPSDRDSFVRVLEFCNLIDDFRASDGTVYKGRLEIYVLDQQTNQFDIVYMGALPNIDGKGNPIPHIVPLIFEHEPEYPYRGLAYAEQLLPQQKELNIARSFLMQSGRKDARIYAVMDGVFSDNNFDNLEKGVDGTILKVDSEKYNGPVGNVIQAIRPAPVSNNILQSMSFAENDLMQGLTFSPAALGITQKVSASEIVAQEGHTQSEFGRHAEQRDIFLSKLITLFLASMTATLYDNGDSEGGDAHLDEEGQELDVDSPESGMIVDSSEASFDAKDEEIMEVSKSLPLDEIKAERKEKENRSLSKLVLKSSSGEDVEITSSDIDAVFDIGFNEAGRSPMDKAERRNNVLALSDKLLQLASMIVQQPGTIMSVLAEESYKSIHEMFELPKNLDWDYIQARLEEAVSKSESVDQQIMSESGSEQSAGQPVPEPEQPSQASPEEIIATLRQLPPDQALDALSEIAGDNPKVMELIDRGRQASPEEQTQIVEILISALEGGNES